MVSTLSLSVISLLVSSLVLLAALVILLSVLLASIRTSVLLVIASLLLLLTALLLRKRPTMHDNRPQSIEAHIISFDRDLYDKEIKIRFVDFVRDDKKFDNFEALKQQIGADEQTIINILNKKI